MLLLKGVVDVVEIVVARAVLLEFETRAGAEGDFISSVVSVVTVWSDAVLVAVTGVVEAKAVKVRVDVLAGMDEVTTVVATTKLTEPGDVCDKVVTTVTAEVAAAEGTPVGSLISIFRPSCRIDRVFLHPTGAQTYPGIQHPPPILLAHGVFPATH